MVYYKKICLQDGTNRDLHRYMMEQHLGRRLSTNEIVHHINGDIKDNRLDNLEVMTRRQHAQHHLNGMVLPEAQKDNLSKMYKGKPRMCVRSVSDRQITKALKLYGENETKSNIERKCGFSMATLYNMLNRQYARHLEFEKEIDEALAKRPINTSRKR